MTSKKCLLNTSLRAVFYVLFYADIYMRRMEESFSRITVYQLKQQNEMVSVTGRERTQAQTGIQS